MPYADAASMATAALVKGLGADVVVDHRNQEVEAILRDRDVAMNSQDAKTPNKTLRVLKAGGKIVSISGPPDPEFGRLLSAGVRRRTRARGLGYAFLFMKANGAQLREITRLIEAGTIRPVADKVFPFEATKEALAYAEAGRAQGKVVLRVK